MIVPKNLPLIQTLHTCIPLIRNTYLFIPNKIFLHTYRCPVEFSCKLTKMFTFRLQQHNTDLFPLTSLPSRPHGECSSPLQRTPKADSPSAHWPTLSCPPFSPPSCLPSNASTDPVSRPAGAAYSHDALPRQAEPHYPHPETLRPRPSGDTAGEGVQVRQRPQLIYFFWSIK